MKIIRMRPGQFPFLLALLLLAESIYGQSLGEVAKKERQRRETNGATAEIVDEYELSSFRDPDAPLQPDAARTQTRARRPRPRSVRPMPARSTSERPTADRRPTRGAPPSEPQQAQSAPVDAQTRWRQRVAAAEARLSQMKQVARRCASARAYKNSLPIVGCDGIEERILRAERSLADLRRPRPRVRPQMER